MLERVTRKLEPGWRMLDAGTGSGILAIGGSCFGASRVVAVESDPLACTTAKRNLRINNVHDVDLVLADVLKMRFNGIFDLITGNLFSEILIKAIPIWNRKLAANGFLILSGILRNQEAAVAGVLRGNAFSILESRRRGKWVAMLAKKGVDARNG